MITIQTAHALAQYFAAVIYDGDYLSDWLTHLPMAMREGVETIGKLYAASVSR